MVRVALILVTLLARHAAFAAGDDGKAECEQVVWVENKAPQISLLYVLVADPANG